MFKVAVDKWGSEYFSVELEGTNYRNVTWFLLNDVGQLLNPSMNVTPRATGPFSDNLTPRDDVLLAFMSLLLLLVLEGLVTSVLLRTKHGNVSNFGFSVKQIVALVQELNFRGIFKERKAQNKVRRKINLKLLIFAVLIISSTFLLEVAVLFLTTPILRDVTNKTATFRIMQPIIEGWHDVRYHIGRSIDRPCEAYRIQGVEQGKTRINGCVTASVSGADVALFSKAENITAAITSLLHEYGAEHVVTINGETAKYSMRAYFSLDDGETRVMRTGPISPHEEELIRIVHKQYIAFLGSVYKAIMADDSVTLETMNDIKFDDIEKKEGEMVDVIPLPGQKLLVKTRSYTTMLRGYLPYGVPTLRLAQHSFRGAAAVYIEDGDISDLTIENGMKTEEAVVWQEKVRAVNWLSLALILMSGMLILVTLRWVMKPVATAEIAGVLVKHAVGAEMSRSPVEVGDDEKKVFRVTPLEREEYIYGAETDQGWVRVSSEYNDRRT